MTEQQLKIALVGAGGKMGMRVSDNLQRSPMTSATSRTPRPANNAPSMPVAASPSPTRRSATPTW